MHGGETAPTASDGPARYVVLYEEDASTAAAREAIRAAGGTVGRENDAIGLATIRTCNADFAADARRTAPSRATGSSTRCAACVGS